MKQNISFHKKIRATSLALLLATSSVSYAVEPTSSPSTAFAAPSVTPLTPLTPLTLAQALQKMQAHYPALQAASEELMAADARVRQSKGSFLPQITANAGYLWRDPVSEMSFGGGTPMQFMPHNNYHATVSAEAILFDFGKRSHELALAQNGTRTAGEQVALSRREAAWQVVQLFYGILFLQEEQRVQQKELQALNKALEFTTKRYQAGTATSFDLATTKARLAALQSRMADSAHALERNEMHFCRLTGMNATQPLALQGSLMASVAPSSNQAQLTEQALKNRVETRLAREAEAAAGQRQALAGKGGAPQLRGNVAYGVANGYQPDIDEIRTTLSAGVTLDVPIFSGFRTTARQQESAAALRAATQRRLDAEAQAATEVAELLNALQHNGEKLNATAMQAEQASLAASHARARYENGMATTLDLLDTEAALSQAELARLQAAYAVTLNCYALQRATGEVFW